MPSLTGPSPALLTWLLRLGVGFAFVVLLFLTVSVPAAVPFLPVVLLAGLGGWIIVRQENWGLYLLLVGFILIADQQDGLQLTEVVYGLSYLGYLGWWYVSRFVIRKDHVVTSPVDWAVLLFLVWAACSVGLTIFFRGNIAAMIGEGLALSMLGFYFPVKELCKKHPDAARNVLIILAILTTLTALRNFIEFRQRLNSAEYLWQIATGRARTNELILMIGSLTWLGMAVYGRTWLERGIMLGLFLLSFAGLIITQSRGYWVSFALGAVVLFLVVSWRKKGQIVLLGLAGGLGFFLVGFLVFPQFVDLLVLGIVDRFSTLGSAGQTDISLLNRFQEWGQVWARIKQNPVLGYGMGTEFTYPNIILHVTYVVSFIHNGYLALWYKFGLPGLGLMLFAWAGMAWHAFMLFRTRTAPRLIRLFSLGALTFLIAETLVANTSNPFIIEDGTLMFAFFGGAVAGFRDRVWKDGPDQAGS
ncbi:MAG: O-antigen ligase family protein [Bacteroidota bacterium]